jgi:hypothetical protein
MAFIWPFTYLGYTLIIDFYDIANIWVGTVGAGGVILLVSFFWILSAIFYKKNEEVTRNTII